MAINWIQLIPWQGSQNTAFEELCCQLTRHETIIGQRDFIRKGTPDGGVECYWTLGNGDEYAWQAKFFLSTLTTSQWSQIKDSFESAITKHPSLKVYYICIPQDRPDARIDGQQSFMDKWNEHVEVWTALAKERSMSVEIRYWGTSEIFDRLSKDQHAGRLNFWFNCKFPSRQWFYDKLQETYNSVGGRYTPELNVDLPIAKVFDAMGCTPTFSQDINKLCGSCIKTFNRLYKSIDGDNKEQYEKKYGEILSGFTIIFSTLRNDKTDINWVNFQNDCTNLIEIIDQTINLLNDIKNKQGPASTVLYVLHTLDRVVSELFEYTRVCRCDEIPKRAILLIGEAGSGKTHLLCDITRRHTEASIPSVLLLGSHFGDFEPRSQIQSLLQFEGNVEQFLSTINTWGETIGSRIFFMIDALNEGPARNIWKAFLPGFIETIQRFKWVCLVVSIRSTFASIIIEEKLKERFSIVNHSGFASVEFEAVSKFFNYYELQTPAIPLLLPEYRNPLFLKLMCQGIQNKKLTRLPDGINGLIDLFSFFIDSVNERFINEHDTDPNSHYINNAIQRLSSSMASSMRRTLAIGEASNILQAIYPQENYSKSLMFFLIQEGILCEEIVQNKTERTEVLRFTYERFSDYQIAQEWLTKSYSKLWRKLRRNSLIYNCLKDEHSYWGYLGIVESLMNLVPEKIGLELFDLVPKCRNYHAVSEAFINSIIWRNPHSINDETRKFVNDVILRSNGQRNKFFSSIFFISSVENHPFNADTLHKLLWKTTLAQRDSWWSIFIHEQYRDKESISAILDWVFAKTNKSAISDESIRLLCTLLCWFLTTSNRFLRDKTTKALVLLLTNRINVLIQLLKAFHGVNDPYVAERLYAVALGCAVCSTDTKLLNQMGWLVYEQVFDVNEVIPNILLRDYARGILEYIHRMGYLENLDVKKIIPPYKSVFKLSVPSTEELDNYGKRESYENKEDWVMMSLLHHSIFHDDFATYVIEQNINWINACIDEPLPKTKKELCDVFIENLESKERDAWESFQSNTETASTARIIERLLQWTTGHSSDEKLADDLYENPEDSNHLKSLLERLKAYDEEQLMSSIESADADVEKQEAEFIALLNNEKKQYYLSTIKPYIGLRSSEEHEMIDPKTIECWIFNRAIELGWSIERFGYFDRFINYHDYGRHANKVERIGKKYQWIALYEILAYLSDNYIYKSKYFHEQKQYNGPWQLTSIRNLDPTCTLQEEHGDDSINCWWMPVSYDAWRELEYWVHQSDDLPNAKKLIDIYNPLDNSDWLVLEGSAEWVKATPVDKEKYEDPTPRIWYQIRSYIVKNDDISGFYDWAETQDFMGRWMPESLDKYHVFLGEFYWSQAYQDSFEFDDEWVTEERGKLPCEVHVPVMRYVQESSTYDCSISDNIHISIPSKKLTCEMELHFDYINFKFANTIGNIVAFDPSISETGPEALLIRKDTFIKYLADNNYSILWTLLGEKNIIQSGGRNKLGRLEINGVYRLDGTTIIGTMKSSYRNY